MNIPRWSMTLVFGGVFTAFFSFGVQTYAVEPTFEAYQKFYLGGQHCGFSIQRYTFDAAAKTVTSISYQYVKFGEHVTTESTVEKSDLNFEPISYHYTALVDNKPITIDATFKNKKMSATMVDGKTKKHLSADVPKSGFLSGFLNYVLLKNGLGVGKGYAFHALSEEDGLFRDGSAEITEEKKIENVPAFKIKFNFKTKFVSLLSDKGEALGTLSEEQNASTEIAPKDKAIAGIAFNEKQIRQLFGNIPEGTKNQLYGKPSTPPAVAPARAAPAGHLSPVSTTSQSPQTPGAPAKDQ